MVDGAPLLPLPSNISTIRNAAAYGAQSTSWIKHCISPSNIVGRAWCRNCTRETIGSTCGGKQQPVTELRKTACRSESRQSKRRPALDQTPRRQLHQESAIHPSIPYPRPLQHHPSPPPSKFHTTLTHLPAGVTLHVPQATLLTSPLRTQRLALETTLHGIHSSHHLPAPSIPLSTADCSPALATGLAQLHRRARSPHHDRSRHDDALPSIDPQAIGWPFRKSCVLAIRQPRTRMPRRARRSRSS